MDKISSIITKARRILLTRVTSGAVNTIPPISHIVFGSGGVDESGETIVPMETQTELNQEFCRYPIDSVTYPIETTARYTVTIPRGAQTGKKFNEMGLVDGEGTLCAIKTMYTKQKDEDVIFTFDFDDEF